MSDTSNTPAVQPYTVTGQVEKMVQQPNGLYLDGVTVSFITAGGVAGSVWLPNTQYNAPNVKAAIEARVEVLNSVQALGS